MRVLLSLFFLWSTPLIAKPIIDVLQIVGKSKADVTRIIGKPQSCRQSKYGEKCSYSKGECKIVYINDKADWITVEAIDNVPFNKAALTSIGLPNQEPSFKSDYTLRWSGIAGLREVSLFKGSHNSDYAYIKAYTR